jgi:hypothetical protein
MTAVLTTVATIALVSGIGCCKSEGDGAARHDVFVDVDSCLLPTPPPSGLGADRALEVVYAFRIDVGRSHDVRRVSSATALDPQEAPVRSCLDRWRFGGWPAGQDGEVRFRYTDLRGWEQLTVAVANYTVIVRQPR